MKLNTRMFAGLIAAGTLAAGGIAYAQPCCDEMGPGMGHGNMHGRMGDMAGRMDQHLARFKGELKITAQQEPLWQAWADKMKQNAGSGMRAMRDKMADPSLTAPQRLDLMTQTMKERLAAMEASNDSFKRLYEALTPEQKTVADKHMSRMGRGGHMGRRGPPATPAKPEAAPKN